jgi:hypothetical protein
MSPDDPQGGYPHESLASAREEAERLWSLRSQGLDARAERRRLIEQKQREEETARLEDARRLNVRQLFDRWRDTRLQTRVRSDGKRTGRKDGGQYVSEQLTRHVFPMIGETPLEHMRKTDLIAVLDAQARAFDALGERLGMLLGSSKASGSQADGARSA